MPTENDYIVSPDEVPGLLTNLPPGGTLVLMKTLTGDLAVQINDRPGGSIRNGHAAASRPTKAELLARHKDLAGRGITITDAARRYNVPRRTIESWTYQTGHVTFVNTNTFPQLIDEAEMAVCAGIYHQRQETGLTGVPYFDDEGRVIMERMHPVLARQRRQKREAEQGEGESKDLE